MTIEINIINMAILIIAIVITIMTLSYKKKCYICSKKGYHSSKYLNDEQ